MFFQNYSKSSPSLGKMDARSWNEAPAPNSSHLYRSCLESNMPSMDQTSWTMLCCLLSAHPWVASGISACLMCWGNGSCRALGSTEILKPNFTETKFLWWKVGPGKFACTSIFEKKPYGNSQEISFLHSQHREFLKENICHLFARKVEILILAV